MTPEWFTEAVRRSTEEILRERLYWISRRLDNFINPPEPSITKKYFDKYFSRLMLEHEANKNASTK